MTSPRYTTDGGAGGSSSGRRPTNVPSVYTSPGYGSADQLEDQIESSPSWRRHRYGEAQQADASGWGQSVFDILDMPDNVDAQSTFTMDIALPGEPGATPFIDGTGRDASGTNVTEMTMARGLEWLRNEALTNREGYNSLVVMLWKAGYLDESDIRLNTFTTTTAQAFIEAAYDVYLLNTKEDGGAVVSLWDNLNAIASGFDESGFGPGSSGSGGIQGPVRQDQRLSDRDLNSAVHDSARSLLGRALNDQEAARVASLYRGVEQQWNDQQWSAQQANFAGQASTVETSPLSSNNAIEDAIRGEFATEKGAQDLASYVGVLGNMMGLGLGGMTDLA